MADFMSWRGKFGDHSSNCETKTSAKVYSRELRVLLFKFRVTVLDLSKSLDFQTDYSIPNILGWDWKFTRSP